MSVAYWNLLAALDQFSAQEEKSSQFVIVDESGELENLLLKIGFKKHKLKPNMFYTNQANARKVNLHLTMRRYFDEVVPIGSKNRELALKQVEKETKNAR